MLLSTNTRVNHLSHKEQTECSKLQEMIDVLGVWGVREFWCRVTVGQGKMQFVRSQVLRSA